MGLAPASIIGILSQSRPPPGGLIWTPRLTTGYGMTGVIGIFGDNQVFVGVNSTTAEAPILRSSDYGITWDEVSITPGFPSFGVPGANCIMLDNNGPIMIVWGQSGYGAPYYSLDRGATWRIANTYSPDRGYLLATDPVHGICAYGNYANLLQRSLDGTEWSTVSKPLGFAPQVMVGGVVGKGIMAVGQYRIHYSYDGGMNWELQNSSPPLSGSGFSVAYGAGKWVMMPGSSATDPIYYSEDDGVTWNTSTNKPAGYTRALKYFNDYGTDVWLAPGDGQVLRSTDGLNFTIQTSGLTDGSSPSLFPYYDVAANGDNFVIVGNATSNHYRVCTSHM